EAFGEMLTRLQFRKATTDDVQFLETLEHLRHEIDEMDAEVIRLFIERMKVAERIGVFKKSNNIAILQPKRWAEILENALQKGTLGGLSAEFINEVFNAMHQESINRQSKMMKENPQKVGR
ncbi:MAG TPA: chorismate mutase, partial [Saprospiraceae bacterium]|nr:chorismate mutase [Saprospiraceae bacterium]